MLYIVFLTNSFWQCSPVASLKFIFVLVSAGRIKFQNEYFKLKRYWNSPLCSLTSLHFSKFNFTFVSVSCTGISWKNLKWFWVWLTNGCFSSKALAKRSNIVCQTFFNLIIRQSAWQFGHTTKHCLSNMVHLYKQIMFLKLSKTY